MAARLGGMADAFGDRNFQRYSLGSITSWLSFFIQAVAVSWTAWDLTHSTRWLAIVALADAAPNVLLMPLGGVLADRHDRFRILLASYALATVQAAVLAGLAFTGALTIGALTAMAAAHGAIHAFSIPANYGFMPRFIERRRLASAIAVSASYTQLGLFAGPALAGWVILHFGAAVAFATNVVGYGIFFMCAASMRTPDGYQAPAPTGRSLVGDWLDGLKAIAGHGGIVAMLGLMLVGDALAAALRHMAPAFADHDLGAGVAGLSTLLACGGVGATVAALWLAQGGARRSSAQTVLWSFLGFLLAIGALMSSPTLPVAALFMAMVGGFFEICRTGTLALLQMSIPDAVRGRVMSTQFLLLRLAGAIGVGGVGYIAGDWGVRAPILIVAALGLAIWAVTFRARRRIAAAFSGPASRLENQS